MSDVANVDQSEYWNGPEGRHWVEHEARFDAMLAPFVEPLLGAAGITAADRVLDVGCGNGATTRAAAARAASVVGIDISAPFVERARRRARELGIDNVELVHGDVQVHPFRPEFGVMVSRFGVMFFGDPVAAFRNLAGALDAGGRVAFVCWQEAAANEWIATPVAALVPVTGQPEAPPPDAPGPFAFADRDRVRGILTDAGLRHVEIHELRLPILLGGGLGVDDTVEFLAGGGLAQRFLGDADAPTVRRAKAAVRDALAPHTTPAGVELGSAAWLVRGATLTHPTVALYAAAVADDELVERLRALEDERAILQTLYQYGHSMDYGPDADFVDCFTPDGVWDVRKRKTPATSFVHRGHGEIAASLTTQTPIRAPELYAKHLVVEPRIVVRGDEASVDSYFLRVEPAETGNSQIVASGRYVDRLVRCDDGRWRFTHRIAEIDDL